MQRITSFFAVLFICSLLNVFAYAETLLLTGDHYLHGELVLCENEESCSSTPSHIAIFEQINETTMEFVDSYYVNSTTGWDITWQWMKDGYSTDTLPTFLETTENVFITLGITLYKFKPHTNGGIGIFLKVKANAINKLEIEMTPYCDEVYEVIDKCPQGKVCNNLLRTIDMGNSIGMCSSYQNPFIENYYSNVYNPNEYNNSSFECSSLSNIDLNVIGGDNKDFIYGTKCGGLDVRLNGGDDLYINFHTNQTNNWIVGGPGNDVIQGVGSTFKGGTGNDYLSIGLTSNYSDPNVDVNLLGEEDNDEIHGNIYDNIYISGGEGNDKVWSYAGDDYVYLGDGNDEGYLGAGDDFLDCGNGNDLGVGSYGVDTMYGNSEGSEEQQGSDLDYLYAHNIDTHDCIYPYSTGPIEFLYGQWDHDHLYPACAWSYVDGGPGGDYIYVSNYYSSQTLKHDIYGGSGNDYIESDAIRSENFYPEEGSDTTFAGPEDDYVLDNGGDQTWTYGEWGEDEIIIVNLTGTPLELDLSRVEGGLESGSVTCDRPNEPWHVDEVNCGEAASHCGDRWNRYEDPEGEYWSGNYTNCGGIDIYTWCE